LYLSPASMRRLNDKRIPIIFNQNGVFFPAWYPHGWQAQNERLARAMEASSHVFYQSAFCKRAADKFLGLTPKSWKILHNAVDTDFFTPPSGPRFTPVCRPVRLLLTGKIGLSTLTRLTSTIEGVAAARRSGANVVLDIYGLISPEAREKADALIARLGAANAVAFKGSYTRAQAADIYRATDIYILNTHNDACPNTVLEAMACGLPVLYSASGGVPELVGGDSSALVAGVGMEIPESFEEQITPSPAQFEKGLENILVHYEAMAATARERATSRFSIDGWIKRHNEVFERLLKNYDQFE